MNLQNKEVSPIQLITKMKKLQQSFDRDSRSTIEKEKKFCRKGTSPSPKDSSNKSESSLSKFWVRNLKVSASGTQLVRALTPLSRGNQDYGLLRTSSIAGKQSQQIDSLKQQVNKQNIQIKRLNIQVSSFQVRLEKQNQKIAQLHKNQQEKEKNNKFLLQRLNEKELKIKKLEEQIYGLNSEIKQKEITLNVLKRQPSHLNKIKSNILQTRAEEYILERERYQNRIKQLQLQLIQSKESQLDNSCSELMVTNPSERSFVSGCQQNQSNDNALRLELYQVKEQVKKMEISIDCIQRRHFKQIQTLKEWKQKEYQELRKKYGSLLDKYKASMKKRTSEQIRDYKIQKEHKRRRSSIDSADSLALSSDSEMKIDATGITNC